MGLGSNRFDKQFGVRGREHGEVVCHYCHKPVHLKCDCWKLQSKKSQFAHVASSVETSSPIVTISTDEYAKFLHLQETMNQLSTPISTFVESESCPDEPISLSSDLVAIDDLDLHIALHKDTISIPKTVREALTHPGWRTTMVEEMTALADNVVYVDDIIIIGNDSSGISSLKSFLHTKFHTKDLGILTYFLGVERSKRICKNNKQTRRKRKITYLSRYSGLDPGSSASNICFLVCFLKKINQWLYVSSLGDHKKHHVPPGEMGWPVFGNIWSFLKAFKSKDLDTFIYNLVKRNGRTGIYKTYLFGNPSIIVCTQETCRRVLADNEQFGLGYPSSTMRLTGKRSFHGIPNSEHKRLRRLTTGPINGHEALSMYIEYIEDTVMQALDEWTRMKEPIEWLKEMRKVAFKVITHIFVGSSAESILGSVEKHYTDLNYGLKSAAINVPGFAFYKALEARNMLVKILQHVMDERRAKSNQVIDHNENRGMIDLLMEIEDENGKKLQDEDIIDLLLVFLLAGHESSAHAALWVIIYLHTSQTFNYYFLLVMTNFHDEQQEILKRRASIQKGLNLEDIREMNYLQKVINETLRRTILSFSNFREAKVDVNLNGYLIPKGWKVLVWNRGVHMDPQVYSNPKEFLRTRWDNCKPKAGSFLPFRAGSRICPGADLAKLEISIFLHYLLLNYKLEQINPGGPIVYLPLPRPMDNCLAKVMKVK
ncbi:Beta-amyrin 11-oxidase [Hibiscus syriacus]|uniref:Beta-amyrin 11-oxidase n=1 Tax=Hibiscus syriacus TaxID=106335 RepID=A0A6A3CTQ6_HIBSY|nr:Beta-amyrin 11-oxidase [Hibiscus syriacus]